MPSGIFIVAQCERFSLELDLNKLIISQYFSDHCRSDRKFQLSMLEVLSFLDIVDKFNTEQEKVYNENHVSHWCHRLLRYIEESYLVKEIELS